MDLLNPQLELFQQKIIGSNNYSYFINEVRGLQAEGNTTAQKILSSLVPSDIDNPTIVGVKINAGISRMIESRRTAPIKNFGEFSPHPFYHLPPDIQYLMSRSPISIETHTGCTPACNFCAFVPISNKGIISERMNPSTVGSLILDLNDLSKKQIPEQLNALNTRSGSGITPLDSLYGNTDAADFTSSIINTDGIEEEVDIITYMELMRRLGRNHFISSACPIGQELTIIRAIEFIINHPETNTQLRLSRNKNNAPRIDVILAFIRTKWGDQVYETLINGYLKIEGFFPTIFLSLAVEDRIEADSLVPTGDQLTKAINEGRTVDLKSIALIPSCADRVITTTRETGLIATFNVPHCALFPAGVAELPINPLADQIIIPVAKSSFAKQHILGITIPEIYLYDRKSGKTTRTTLDSCEVEDPYLRDILYFIHMARRLAMEISMFVASLFYASESIPPQTNLSQLKSSLAEIKSKEVLDQDIVLRYALEKLTQRIDHILEHPEEGNAISTII